MLVISVTGGVSCCSLTFRYDGHAQFTVVEPTVEGSWGQAEAPCASL